MSKNEPRCSVCNDTGEVSTGIGMMACDACPPEIPDGMALVPLKLSTAMHCAAVNTAMNDRTENWPQKVFDAVLHAHALERVAGKESPASPIDTSEEPVQTESLREALRRAEIAEARLRYIAETLSAVVGKIAYINSDLTPEKMVMHGRYNWKTQPERLIYLGKKGGWHQFKNIDDTRAVWCEVPDGDLRSFEQTGEPE